MIELREGGIVLRAFGPEEIDVAMERMQSIPAADLDEEEARIRRERLEHSGERNDSELMLAVEADGRLVGDVQGRCLRFAMPPGVWELGIELWDGADRGRGIGRQTIALLSSYLFERERAIRVQATTDVDNVAMRRVLDHLGFEFEGVLRGFMPVGSGPPRDYAMYGLTRADVEGDREDGWTPTS